MKIRLTTKTRCYEKKTWYQEQHVDSALGDLKKRMPRKFKNAYAYICNQCTWYHISSKKLNGSLGYSYS